MYSCSRDAGDFRGGWPSNILLDDNHDLEILTDGC